MKRRKREPLAWVLLGLLAALVATNVAFLVVLRTIGPLIGVALYAALFAVVWRGRRPDNREAMVGGLVGLAVHIVEIVLVGWSAYPSLVALNLILPAALVPVAWLAGRQAGREGKKPKGDGVDADPDR